MSRHVDYVVDTAGNPVITIGVAACAIAGEVQTGVGGEIGLEEPLMVAVHGTRHAGPTVAQAEPPFASAFEHLSALVDDHGIDTKERQRCRTGLGCDRSGQRRDKDAASLGLPPGINDRTATLANDVVIPEPGFRIDRLADRAEHSQGLAARLLD